MHPIQQAYANGWATLIPITPGQKFWSEEQWQKFVMTEKRLQWALDSGYTTFGMLAKYAPGVDIDIDDEDYAVRVGRLARTMLGPAPVRWGRKPRCLLPYRTETPFGHKELTIVRNSDGKVWQVEVMGEGQQYVLMGEHPTAGEYQWSESPVNLPFNTLPVVTEEQVISYLEAVAKLFPEPNWTVTLNNSRRRTGSAPSSADLMAPSIEAVEELVSVTPNPTATGYREFSVFGLALHGATGGSAEGKEIFDSWCERWEREKPDGFECNKLWRTAKPISGWNLLQSKAHDFGRESFNGGRFDFDVVTEKPVESVVTKDTLDLSKLFTPADVAEYLATQDIEHLAFDAPSERWYRHFNGVWQTPSGRSSGRAFVLKTVKDMLKQIVIALEDTPMAPNEKKEDRFKRITKLKTPTFADNVRRCMELDTTWDFDATDFDEPITTNHLLNTPSGTYNLDTYQMQPHDPQDYICKQTKVSPKFDNTKIPKWLDMLNKVVKTDDERDYLQRYLGSALSGTTANKVMLALHGASNSGKSTITDTIATTVLGVGPGQYAAVAPSNIILRRPQSRDDQHPAGVNLIRDVRFAVSHEGGDGLRWHENIIKKLTGGDAIPARPLFGQFSTKRFYGRLLSTTNVLPATDFLDSGMRQRMLVMELVRIPDSERKDFRDQIEAEAEYILGWLIDGHRMNQERPVHDWDYVPESIKQQTKDALEEGDPVGRFVTEAVILDPDGWTSLKDLHANMLTFCNAREIPVPNSLLSSITFGKTLKQIPQMAPLYHRSKAVAGYDVMLNTKLMSQASDEAMINELLEPPE